MSYDLRRLRLHGLIERIAGTQRYELTALGRRTTLFYPARLQPRSPPWSLQIAHPNLPLDSFNLTAAFHHLEVQLTNYSRRKKPLEKLDSSTTISSFQGL